MKKSILFCIVSLLAAPLLAADSSPKDDVTSAAKKLGDSANYTWHTTVTVPESSQYTPGPTDGKTEKGGITYVKQSIGDNTMEFAKKGTAVAYTDRDGNWQGMSTNADTAGGGGGGRGNFGGMMARNFKAPDAQAADLAAAAKSLTKDGDVYSGDLTDDGVKPFLAMGGRRGGAPTVTNPSGSVKFWITDGMLTKYEFKVKGTVSFNGNDRDIDRDTTVEIKDVGKTTVDAPDAAKKLL